MTVVVTDEIDCTVEGCESRGRRRSGMCRVHYDYLRYHGTTDVMPGQRTYKQVHKLTDVNTERQVATCAGCGPDSPIYFRPAAGHWQCRTYRSQALAKVDRVERRATHVLWKFGISAAEHDALLAEQGGVCAICAQTCSSGRRLAVDHDHLTGKVRGLLCGNCNNGLGRFRDDPSLLQAALAYLS